MWLRMVAGLAIAFAATAAWADCPQYFPQGMAPAAVSVELICHTSYAIGFRAAWGDPAWSAEHLTADQVAAAKNFSRSTGGDFHPETALPKAERVTKADYNKAGYDRGHMSPAADFGADKAECFSMANMVPQTGELNRTIWAGIESAVRDLAASDGELFIVTGPLISPGNATIAKGKVAVPSQTWKAIYDPKQGTGAYICENTHAPVCRGESIDALVQQIGFDPFPGVAANLKATAFALPQPSKGGQLAN